MAIFALAASLSPGPVNLMSLSTSARSGWRTGLMFVTGATVGFIILFLLIGFGLHYVLSSLPWITKISQWLGIAFLLYLSYQLFNDDGELQKGDSHNTPNFLTGAIMQWINPKAWLATLSGIVAYIPEASAYEVVIFACIYLPICWLSLSLWVWAGVVLGQYFNKPQQMRLLNKILAGLLIGSCVLILI
jgi:threonine/homoserine/homoserine lactone efflux protein